MDACTHGDGEWQNIKVYIAYARALQIVIWVILYGIDQVLKYLF